MVGIGGRYHFTAFRETDDDVVDVDAFKRVVLTHPGGIQTSGTRHTEIIGWQRAGQTKSVSAESAERLSGNVVTDDSNHVVESFKGICCWIK